MMPQVRNRLRTVCLFGLDYVECFFTSSLSQVNECDEGGLLVVCVCVCEMYTVWGSQDAGLREICLAALYSSWRHYRRENWLCRAGKRFNNNTYKRFE